MKLFPSKNDHSTSRSLPLMELISIVLAMVSTRVFADMPLKLGPGNTGGQQNSIAAGKGNNLGPDGGDTGGSIAVGLSNTMAGVTSQYGTAVFGSYNHGNASTSLTSGVGNTTSAYAATALGFGNQVGVDAIHGLAAGYLNVLEGPTSIALGGSLTARSWNSVVIGRWNAALPGETYFEVANGVNKEFTYSAAKMNWRATDSLFVVGNGTSPTARNNAFVITKNGAVSIPSGLLTVGGYQVLTANSGRASGTSIGWNSLSLGDSTIASGQSSTALGHYTKASGGSSTALGYYNTASGQSSLAAGRYSEAEGSYSMALGSDCTARGESSFAAGFASIAMNMASIGMGLASRAHGSESTAIGNNCIALVNNSHAIGDHTNAWRQGQTVVGRYNAFPADQPIGTDQRAMPKTVLNPPYALDDEVFVVGGGYTNPSWGRWNALTVKASGDVKALGKVEANGAVLTGGVTVSGSVPMIVSVPSTFTQPIILQGRAITGDIPMYTGN